ncbi:MAG: hypothetical protein O3A00_22285 [Planctomycetota bacterium]|nr:hypothetical protein [Planctomycetota bacterium]
MKRFQYLTGFAVLAVICGLAAIAGGQNQYGPPSYLDPSSPQKAPVEPNGLRNVLDSNPSLLPWLLSQVETGNDDEQELVSKTLVHLAPFAASDLVKALKNENPKTRNMAITLLPHAAVSPTFPTNDAIRELLKIAQDAKADADLRILVKAAICEIIQLRCPTLHPQQRLAAQSWDKPAF